VRPFLNRNTVEPFTAQEAKVAADTDDRLMHWSTTRRRAPRWSSRASSRWRAMTATSSS
jgi:hypothetical protein